MSARELKIQIIRQWQYYKPGRLESMPDEEIDEIYERLLDWMEE